MFSPPSVMLRDFSKDKSFLQSALVNLQSAEEQISSCHPFIGWQSAFLAQCSTWVTSLAIGNTCEDIALAYDDMLLRLDTEKLVAYLKPTDMQPAHWTSSFIPHTTVLPPGSQDESERTALFIASHENTHFLYQWQCENGWKHIPIKGNTMFFTHAENPFANPKELSNYLDGISLSKHAIYSAQDADLPFAPLLQIQKKQISSAQHCRIWGNALSCNLQWNALELCSPQADGSLHIRRFRKWGLSALCKDIFPSFVRPCDKLYKIFITQRPYMPECSDSVVTADFLWKQIGTRLQNFIHMVQYVPCSLFLDGWFNSSVLRSQLSKKYPLLFHFGEENVFTPWHRTLCQ